MSDTKWTPGPWVAAATSDLMLWVARGEPDGEIIAQLDSVNPYDAHLIAAAPDLYEALEDLFKELTLGDFDLPSSLKPEIAQAAKALAKARGEA